MKKQTSQPEMTIIGALDRVQEKARHSKLSDEFWHECASDISFLSEKLGLSDKQVVLVAIMCEIGESISWRRLGEYLNISRLRVMSLTPEIEDLKDKHWLYSCSSNEYNGRWEAFHLMFGVVTALRNNRVFEPEKINGLSIQEFIDNLINYKDNDVILPEDKKRWMLQLVDLNGHLPLCNKIQNLQKESSKITFLLIVADYAEYAASNTDGITLFGLREWFGGREYAQLSKYLRNGSHELLQEELIEYGCNDGMINTEEYKLTDKTREELLGDYKPMDNKSHSIKTTDRNLRSSATITPKTLFFNDKENQQIERLKKVLNHEGLNKIQEQLAESGLRRGITCLFYGGPGTGKTESVLQLARETGRDILQIEIAGLKDKYVGESEKNIQNVFNRYRKLCANTEKMPILFFNEADAIINQRMERISHSVDQMNNAIQNIILQELENLDGIFIATTNLTGLLDKAFERRFLFKVEFSKPDIETRKNIWHSILPTLCESDYQMLAKEFNFSGGQIENVARRCKIEYALSGQSPTLPMIEQFCKEEYLNKNERGKVGFN